MFKTNQSQGFTLFEIVALVAIMAIVFAFYTPKYIRCVHDTHNAKIDMMAEYVKIWSSEQAVDHLRHKGTMKYPLPSSVKISRIIKEGSLKKWDDSDPMNWKYIAGGGIKFEGDGTYLDVFPIHIN